MFDENDIEWDVREIFGDVVITARYGALMMSRTMAGREASVELGLDIKRQMAAEIRQHVNPLGVMQASGPRYEGPTFQPYQPYHTLTFQDQYQVIPHAYGPPVYQRTGTIGDDPIQYMALKPKLTPEMEAYNEYDQSDD